MVEKYKFGYIRGQRIIVFDNPTHSFQVLGGHFLEDITVELKKEGRLRITGKVRKPFRASDFGGEGGI